RGQKGESTPCEHFRRDHEMRRHCPGHHQRSQKHQALRAGGGSFGRNKRRASETVTKRKRSRSDYGGRPGGCRTESGRSGCGRKSQISGSKFQVKNQIPTSKWKTARDHIGNWNFPGIRDLELLKEHDEIEIDA